MHNEELQYLYKAVWIVTCRTLRWARHVRYDGENKRIQNFGGKSLGILSLAKSVKRWEENIKMMNTV
jgi:hypothetical protein